MPSSSQSATATVTLAQVETKEKSTPTIASTPTCDLEEPLPLVDAILTPEDMIRSIPFLSLIIAGCSLPI